MDSVVNVQDSQVEDHAMALCLEHWSIDLSGPTKPVSSGLCGRCAEAAGTGRLASHKGGV